MTSTSDMERHEVLVLGGGVAGLIAARKLLAAGIDVAVLEARDRFGGRVVTVRDDDGEVIELGAEFVHGRAPLTTALAEEGELELEAHSANRRWLEGGRSVDGSSFERFLHETMHAIESIAKTGPDRSFAEVLDASGCAEPGRSLAREYVQSFQAADANRISARSLAMGDLGDSSVRRFATGYGGLVDFLVDGLPPEARRSKTVVQSVRWARGSVEVHASPSLGHAPTLALAASRVVVALPLGILDDVRFVPPVVGKKDSLRRLAAGDAVRVVLRFREAFWRERAPAPALFRAAGSVFPVFWTGPHPDSTHLVAWSGGPAAASLRGFDPLALADQALAVLSITFAIPRATLDGAFVEARSHDWSNDPFARGAYSYPLVGGSDAGRSLAAPVDDTLFFAGEATCEPPENGTVEGALASGVRAAREVLHAMGRPTGRTLA